MTTTRTTGRPLKVGIQLPEVEREVRWPELLDMVRAIEDLGFDSVWVGEHLLYRWPDRPARGPWEAWTLLSAIAASTDTDRARAARRLHELPQPGAARQAGRAIDEISGGRFVLGLGAGWNETEFRAFGFPYDHRIDRFEEAFTIIRTLLRDGAIDFDGRWYQARDCELLPRGPRPGRPAADDRLDRAADAPRDDGPRRLLERLVQRHGQPTRPAWPALRDLVDEACRDVGRDPAEVERTVAVARPAARRRRPPPGLDARRPRSRRSTATRPRSPTRCAGSRARGSPTSSSSSTRSRSDAIRAVAPVLAELDRG